VWSQRDAGRCPGWGCSGGCAVDVSLQTRHLFIFILYLTVWGVESVVTHQTSWLALVV